MYQIVETYIRCSNGYLSIKKNVSAKIIVSCLMVQRSPPLSFYLDTLEAYLRPRVPLL